MMANRQQVGYVAVFLIAVAVLPTGLVALWRYPLLGVILILSALALAIQSVVELYRVRRSGSAGNS
jgi:hypothetical protein